MAIEYCLPPFIPVNGYVVDAKDLIESDLRKALRPYIFRPISEFPNKLVVETLNTVDNVGSEYVYLVQPMVDRMTGVVSGFLKVCNCDA